MPDDSWITPDYLVSLKTESEQSVSRNTYLQNARRGWKWYKKRGGIIPIAEFDDQDVDVRHATTRDNVIKETVDEGLSIFLKNDPVIRRYPHYPSDADLVDDMDAANLSAWRHGGARSVVSSALKEAFVAGMSTVKVYWDVKAKKIARMANMSKEVLNRLLVTGASGNPEETADPFIDVYEYWIFPVTQHDSALVHGDTNLDDAGYPYGVVATIVEDHIVKKKKNPFAGTAKRLITDQQGNVGTELVKIGSMRNPFVQFYWDRISDEAGNNRIYECMGMVEQMIPMQFNIDAIRRQIYINLKTTANPGGAIIIDGLETPPEEITREPGELIEFKDVGRPVSEQVMLFDGQTIPNAVLEMPILDRQTVKAQVGMRAGVSSQYPRQGTSHTPALTIGAVQEQEFGPLWEHVKELGFALEDMSILMDGLMQQFYKPGDFKDVSEHGETRHIEWTQRHIVANFRREVVAAATTSFFDLDKMNRLAEITAITNEALMSNNPDLIQSTISLLVNSGYPDAFDWIQQLRNKQQQLQQQEQELQALGALGLSQQTAQGVPQGGNVAPQQALPPASDQLDDDELAGLEQLKQLTGMPAEELMALVSE
jgi:hypothetical protein